MGAGRCRKSLVPAPLFASGFSFVDRFYNGDALYIPRLHTTHAASRAQWVLVSQFMGFALGLCWALL